jgi:F0F1-type ATP synthase membrane subunit b/b'
MASEGPQRASEAPALTSLPRVEDLPAATDGYDREKVREAFEAFRRHTTQLQVQLRVLQSAGQSGVEPTGHAVRMDSLHLIRAAAEMADTIERDAQSASAAQFRRTEEEVARRQRELQQREGEVERFRNESERQRAELLNAAKAEARQTVQEAEQQASQEVKEAESRAARLLEQARHQATELTNAARAEVEQTLEWARSQAGAIIHRAQDGAEQLLAAAGLGEEATGKVAESIVDAARAAAEASRGGLGPEQSTPLRGPEPVRDEPHRNAAPPEAPADEQEPVPPLSPPVSPGPPPPSPPEEREAEPTAEGDQTDDG